MNIQLTPDLTEYLREHHLDSFTLSMKRTGSCCSICHQVIPTFGPPTEETEPYDIYAAPDGITVYISPTVEFTRESPTFGLARLLKFHQITMSGIQVATR